MVRVFIKSDVPYRNGTPVSGPSRAIIPGAQKTHLNNANAPATSPIIPGHDNTNVDTLTQNSHSKPRKSAATKGNRVPLPEARENEQNVSSNEFFNFESSAKRAFNKVNAAAFTKEQIEQMLKHKDPDVRLLAKQWMKFTQTHRNSQIEKGIN
jgi:hypothetical protein